MNLSKKKKCKNCRLIGSHGCTVDVPTKTENGELVPVIECFKPLTFRDECNFNNKFSGIQKNRVARYKHEQTLR